MNFCPQCGHAMSQTSVWPKRCEQCGREHFKNPVPVAVVLVPVDNGILTVRRAIPPGKDRLALPGGFVNWGESWQEAGAREVAEETGLEISPSELSLVHAESVSEGVLLLFALAAKRESETVKFHPDAAEISEIVICSQPEELAFPTHTAQLQAYFQHSGK